ncbi:MAG: cellulose biosynthesis cyclic di-GMP-binding regulatory protein BcsB [Candidatus Aenigmatarchaeota archaeon]
MVLFSLITIPSTLLSETNEIPFNKEPVQENSAGSLQKKSPKFINKPLSAYATTKFVVYSFRDLNFLKEDMVLRGINPSHDFYIPVYDNLVSASITLKITIPTYLRKDSLVSILIDDIPYYMITLQNYGRPIRFDIKPKKGNKYIKISIKGNLRVSENICEDVFSDKPYLIIHADSKVGFKFKQAEDIKTFLMDYERQYCIEDLELLPIVYYLSKVRKVPPIFNWGINNSCEKIIKISQNATKLDGNTLYLTKLSVEALQNGFDPLFFGKFIKVDNIIRKENQRENKVSLNELGIKSSTVRGMSNISIYIPFNSAIFGGMPDNLYFKLNFTHTPAHQKDKMELRVYLNDILIKSIPLEGYGTKSLDIKIPVQELSFGHNSLVINLVNFTSSDYCFGAVTQSALTVYDNSYFYWNSVNKKVYSIADFFKIVNGNLGLLIEDREMLPLAVKLLNILPEVNKHVKTIEIIEDKNKKYDYVLSFIKSPTYKGLFEIYDPIEKTVIFSAKYGLPFIFFSLSEDTPTELRISSYDKPDYVLLSDKYIIDDYMNLFGNVAVISENYIAAFEIGKKLRIHYTQEKSLSYYWTKYKLLVLILLSIPIIYLIIYTYKRLTRRAT